MKAYKYKVIVSIDAVHSWGDREVEEIWIPDYNIFFNEECGCSESKEPRNEKYEEIEIDTLDAYDLHDYIAEKEHMGHICKQYFKKEKEK